MHRTLLIALALFAVPAHADDVGLRILDQAAWTPLTDDETVHTVFDDPSLVSRVLRDAWPAASPSVEAPLAGGLVPVTPFALTFDYSLFGY